MNRHFARGRRTLAALAAFAAFALSAPAGPGGHASARPPVTTQCEGDACAQVAVTFDGEKGQYRARNNSAERWARVSASNLAASSAVCLAPGAEGYLELKSIVGSYRAEQAEPRCGGLGAGR